MSPAEFEKDITIAIDRALKSNIHPALITHVLQGRILDIFRSLQRPPPDNGSNGGPGPETPPSPAPAPSEPRRIITIDEAMSPN